MGQNILSLTEGITGNNFKAMKILYKYEVWFLFRLTEMFKCEGKFCICNWDILIVYLDSKTIEWHLFLTFGTVVYILLQERPKRIKIYMKCYKHCNNNKKQTSYVRI